MRKLLLASVFAALPLAADALPTTQQLIVFGQTSNSNTLSATVAGNATTLSVVDGALDITQILPPGVPGSAFLDLTATSIDAAVGVGLALLQHYSGSFCITSATGCGGTNFLSGTFTDAAFGLATGSQLSVNVSNPPDTLALSSSVIPASELLAPNSFTLALSNVSPALSSVGSGATETIAPFTASFAGDADAAVPAAEPASLALMLTGLGLLGLVWRRGE